MDTFAEIVRSRAGDDSVGLRFEGREWTWAQVVQEGADRAAAIREIGLGSERGQPHIGVLLDNVPDYLFWLCAGALAGAVVVGINPSRRGEELAQDIRHTECDVIITESRQIGLLEEIEHGLPARRVVNIDEPTHQEFLAPYRCSGIPARVPDPDELLLLLFSSGSTGAPKAVIVGQGRLGALAQAMVERTGLGRESVTYLCMPLFHGNAVMMNFAPALACGARIAMVRKFSASAFSPDLHLHGVTYVNYVGRALSYVLATAPDSRDATSTLVTAFGTEASDVDIDRFQRRFGCTVHEGYGLSEGVFRINRTADSPPGSLGKPVQGVDVRIMDESTGEECPPAQLDADGKLRDPGAIGQMVALGKASAFEGYYRNPGAMADRVHGDDFWSGDLGYRDQNGFFYFAGRSSDWLRVDSENFSAAPVERILQRFGPVTTAVVYAVPDPRTGDQVMCALELAENHTFDADEFTEFLDAQPDMGTKWRPRFVRLVDEVPLTGTNKIDKNPLRRVGWNTADPVWWRVGRSTAYRPFARRDREELEREFGTHGRAALLP